MWRRYKICSNIPMFQCVNHCTAGVRFHPTPCWLGLWEGSIGVWHILFYHPSSQNMCRPPPPSQKLLLFCLCHTHVHRPCFSTAHIKFISGWFLTNVGEQRFWILAVQWLSSFLLIGSESMNYNDPSKNDLRSIVIPYFLCDKTYPFSLCCNLGPTSVSLLLFHFWLPQIKAQTKCLLFIFYTQIPFWSGQIETQLCCNSKFQNPHVGSVQLPCSDRTFWNRAGPPPACTSHCWLVKQIPGPLLIPLCQMWQEMTSPLTVRPPEVTRG